MVAKHGRLLMITTFNAEDICVLAKLIYEHATSLKMNLTIATLVCVRTSTYEPLQPII